MSQRINLKSEQAAPAYDIESIFLKHPTSLLPDPPGIPFDKQGAPLPDIQQHHVSYAEVEQATQDTKSNPLPTKYWTGTSYRQINKGGPTFYLGVNENRKRS